MDRCCSCGHSPGGHGRSDAASRARNGREPWFNVGAAEGFDYLSVTPFSAKYFFAPG